MIATKFVSWEVPALQTLSGCKAYQIRENINKGIKLSRQEKNWITKSVNSNTYFKQSVPVQGWQFSFADVLKRFWVSQNGYISEYYAMDKTSLRQILFGRIDKIVEL